MFSLLMKGKNTLRSSIDFLNLKSSRFDTKAARTCCCKFALKFTKLSIKRSIEVCCTSIPSLAIDANMYPTQKLLPSALDDGKVGKSDNKPEFGNFQSGEAL